MAIEFVRDELDKRREGILETPTREGFHRRWVRTSGYQPAAHLERMKRLGYQRVEAKAEETLTELAQKRRGRPKQVDRTVTNGDVILMECPVERYNERRKDQREQTARHLQGAAYVAGATGEVADTIRKES